MALGAQERIIGGWARDMALSSSAGQLGPILVTTSTVGATTYRGMLRDPDGRLVVAHG